MASPQRWTLAATILASSMTFIDGTVVNVALPALQARLHATITDVQWVMPAFLVPGSLAIIRAAVEPQFSLIRGSGVASICLPNRILL